MRKFICKNSISVKELKQMIELDKKVYSYEDAGVFHLCKQWYNKNSNIYTILKRNNKLIGYINFMPLSNNCYGKYKLGELSDSDINKEDILNYSKGNTYNGLLTSIVIDENYRNSEAIKLLWNAFIDKLNNLKHKNIFINEVLADCVSQDGEKFIKKLGFEYITNSKSGKIYEGEIKLNLI